mmetsp:Transcript_66584/g.189030  ORF Transcript_66584/g.189030 Transcript_66584/m.189030 type:complete len:224 (+) Transcript_66584:64-735(+)
MTALLSVDWRISRGLAKLSPSEILGLHCKAHLPTVSVDIQNSDLDLLPNLHLVLDALDEAVLDLRDVHEAVGRRAAVLGGYGDEGAERSGSGNLAHQPLLRVHALEGRDVRGPAWGAAPAASAGLHGEAHLAVLHVHGQHSNLHLLALLDLVLDAGAEVVLDLRDVHEAVRRLAARQPHGHEGAKGHDLGDGAILPLVGREVLEGRHVPRTAAAAVRPALYHG